MTQPESCTVEDRLAALIHGAIDGPGCEGEPDPKWQGDPDRAPLLPHDLSDVAAYVLAAAKEHGLVIGGGELDAAWKEAEAALPDGWAIYLQPSVTGAEWHAQGRTRGIWMMANGPLPEENAEGPSPAAALKALAERLRR